LASPDHEKPPLNEVAYRRLRADIIACRLPPGQRLTERSLAARTGFGISSIRDALTRLAHDGLVRTVPRKGYQVKPLSIKVVDDLFLFWGTVGPELVRLGIQGATAAELSQAAAGFRELSRLAGDGGPTRERVMRGVGIVSRSFGILANATGNEYFISTFTRVDGEISRVWTLVVDAELPPPGRVFAGLDHWQDTLSRRDGGAGADGARTYIEQAHQQVLRALARWPSVITSEVVPPSRAADAR
jgi:DNA-binding GntR family transcriptional regulator